MDWKDKREETAKRILDDLVTRDEETRKIFELKAIKRSLDERFNSAEAKAAAVLENETVDTLLSTAGENKDTIKSKALEILLENPSDKAKDQFGKCNSKKDFLAFIKEFSASPSEEKVETKLRKNGKK